ncbi:MAG: ATP-grasp domain-containing protein [Candidatus Saccharimonadales bacterium]
MKRVLVLYSFRSNKTPYTDLLFGRLKTRGKVHGLDMHRGSLKDLRISIYNNKLHIIDSMTGFPIDDYDVVYFELWYKSQQQALVAANYLAQKGVPFMSHELKTLTPMTKVGELGLLADRSVPLPNTFISSAREIEKVFRQQPPLDYPFILKAADACGGKNNHLVNNYKNLKDILRENKDVQYVAQEFIPNDCDYRCLVLGGEIKLVLKRTRQRAANTHLNNTSAGAKGEIIPVEALDKKSIDAVINAAEVLGRAQFSGVDLIIDKNTGSPYILEVNQTPQIEIGAEVDKKMDALLNYIKEMGSEK